MLNSGVHRSASLQPERRVQRKVCVYDHRYANRREVNKRCLETTNLDFSGFCQVLRQEFEISSNEPFVVVTTDRTLLDSGKFEKLQDGSTLHLFQRENQALSEATKEHIKFEPHHNTITGCGLYAYYASEGQNPLSYALAELIDNSLSATAKNKGERTIEIRVLFDEIRGEPAVIILDNGCGMTSKQLNNWAVYRLSKFNREDSKFPSQQEAYVRPDPVPRSLNSDISFFGVGGKQAAFYIGESTMMISKPVGSPDVHELVLSKEDFERKARDKEDVYSAEITHRKPGDSSHVKKDDERFLHDLIREEHGKESFTAVVITGVKPEHITFLKENFKVWTRQLAHVYHYYIHGVNGRDITSSATKPDRLPKIEITLRRKPPACPCVMNLTEVEDDMQSLYIRAAADTFEFRASVEKDGGTVEGIIRYHPFFYDRETYPEDPSAEEDNNDYDDELGDQSQERKEKKIFECFWNGRLIPYTKVSELFWCSRSSRNKNPNVPAECYSRLSGVLFTDDKFTVTTNKLTYTDLELKLMNKDNTFTRVVRGQKQSGRNIEKDFMQWLQTCHEKYDKQMQFLGYKETITRPDVSPKTRQYPWAVFSSIKWGGEIYKKGQYVKSQRTLPILYGTVIRFLLYGDHSGNVFATNGVVEVALEPKAFHDKNKIIPISKIDRAATEEAIKKNIENDLAKLPHNLTVDWPEGNPWPQNAVRPAGTPLGPIKVEILNKTGGSTPRMPTVGQGTGKKLVVELKVTHNGQDVLSCVAQHSPTWGYYFKKIANLTRLGKYTLTLTTAIHENNATVFGGRPLPTYKLNFTIKEGDAESFVICPVSSDLRVGVPFDIPLRIKDCYEHPAPPPPNLKPVLGCSGLDVTYEKVDVSGTTVTIRSVRARGKLPNYQQSKQCDLKVTLPGMKKDTQSIGIILLPGKPHSLHVKPEENPITAENGNPVRFEVEVHDEAGNITAQPKQIVRCQIQGLKPTEADCRTGVGQFVTETINLKITKGEPQKLKVQFAMPSQRNVTLVVRELKVLPSTRVSSMELYRRDDENLVLRPKEEIDWVAGGLLEHLCYRLFDEAGKEVPLTDEIASKIKVNWTQVVNLKDLAQGMLPDVPVPKVVQEEHLYVVSYQDVSASFNIAPRPDEPRQLKATLPQTSVKLGETLPGDINLELVDQYGNATKTLIPTCVHYMSVEAEGLDKSAIKFVWQECSSSVLVTGVRFQSGTPGAREMCFTYRNYEDQVVLKVTPGVPAQLKLVSQPEEPLQVLNDQGISTPFVVQLCDKWGNPSPDRRVVVELSSSPPTLKVTANVMSQPVDSEGKASFIVHSVSGKGYYQLNFNVSINMKPLPGPSVNLTVIPDPNKPVSLSVEFDSTAKFPAGGKFPVFSVTVVSDEGSPMTSFNPADVSMFLWSEEAAGNEPPLTATKLTCSQKTNCFLFRDKEIPEQAEKHAIQFSLRIDQTKYLFSDQIPIHVVANQPVKLEPDSQPPPPVVSYSKAISNRTLVENMTLRIRDSYGNPAGEDLDGKVKVSIMNSSGDDNNKILPLFEGRVNSIQFNLVEGKADITRLTVMENSPGENGSSYILLFKPEVSMVSTPLAAFELQFHFVNDVDNQLKMSQLSKRKDDLTRAVVAYKEVLGDYDALLEVLTAQHLDTSRKETQQREDLNRRNIRVAQNVSIPHVDRLIAEKMADVDGIERMPRRVFSVRDNFTGQQDVLGMVGHLAFVQDDDAARVISWSIRGDMDCIITRTTEAAMKIYNNTQGRQQVMALDSIYISPGNRPLPHIRNGRILFKPSGNPVYARDLLIYRQDQKSCDTVFKNILGDTILIDDLDSANNYRRTVVQNKMPCPTILTRQGDRVSGKGKFGGAQNKAPPMHTLQVFGAPYPQQFNILKEEIDLLRQYRSALQKRDEAAKEREDHLSKMRSPETRRMTLDMKEKERQLKEIERQYASTPVRPVKRGPGDAGEPSGINTKRARP